MMRMSHKMSVRTPALSTPKVGSPMTIAIDAWAVEAEETMMMVRAACNVGFMAFLKVSFMPDAQTNGTGGSVGIDGGWS